jgi:hypothetical protein
MEETAQQISRVNGDFVRPWNEEIGRAHRYSRGSHRF